LIWLRIGTGGERLWMRWWTSTLNEFRTIYWLADGLLASQEGLCSVELFLTDMDGNRPQYLHVTILSNLEFCKNRCRKRRTLRKAINYIVTFFILLSHLDIIWYRMHVHTHFRNDCEGTQYRWSASHI
jgi:hypothetical protein